MEQTAGKTSVVTLCGVDESSKDVAVSSWVDVVSGSSVSVYRTQDFVPENPVYRVKTQDKSGDATEQIVNVSGVDPKNCDTVEMYAYIVSLGESGKGSFEDTVLKAVVAKAVKMPNKGIPAHGVFGECGLDGDCKRYNAVKI